MVNGSNFSDLPNVTYVSNAVVAWKHGQGSGDGTSNYPAIFMWNMTEGNSYIRVDAYNVKTDSEVGISYDDSGKTTQGYKIHLDHPIEFTGESEHDNKVNNFRQGWMPTYLPDMMDSSRDTFYSKDHGFRVEKANYFWNSTWQFHGKEVVPAGVAVNKSNSSLSHRLYSSQNNLVYEGYDGQPSRWIKVNTTVEGKPGDHFFVYNYTLKRAIVFDDVDAELVNGSYVIENTTYDPRVRIVRNATYMNVSREVGLNYTVNETAAPTIGEVLTVMPQNTTVNVTPNNVTSGEVENFTAQATSGNVSFRVTGLNDSHNYTVYRDGVVVVENGTPDNGTLAFSNSNWSKYTFAVVDSGTVSEGDGGNGMILGSGDCEVSVLGFTLSCTVLRSVGFGLGLSVIGIALYTFYRRRQTLFGK
jgi:hypothetical protein